jgi:hypothetical protein
MFPTPYTVTSLATEVVNLISTLGLDVLVAFGVALGAAIYLVKRFRRG